MFQNFTIGKYFGGTVQKIEYHEVQESYNEVVDYLEKNVSIGGVLTSSYYLIINLEVVKVKCGGVSYCLTNPQVLFYNLEYLGYTILVKLKVSNIIKGVLSKECQNLKI